MKSRVVSISNHTARAARATATVQVAATQNADDTVVINGTTLTWKVSPANQNQILIGADAEAGAANLESCIDAHTTLSALITTSTVTDTVTLQAIAYGTGGNAYTLTEAGSSSTVSGATFTGGVAAAIPEESGKTHIITGYNLTLDAAGELSFYTGVTAMTGAIELLADHPIGLADSDGLFACATGEPFSILATTACNGWVAYRTVSG